MVKLKNLGEAVHVYRPAGDANSLLVEHDQVLEAPGEITEELDDAYIVGAGDDVRAYPKAQWELVKPAKKPTKSDAAKDED